MHKIITLILIATTTLVIANPKASKNNIKEDKYSLSVTITKPKFKNKTRKIYISGNITAKEKAIIVAKSRGLRLLDSYVDIGDKVKKGQVLAIYDNSEIKNGLDIAKLNTEKAEQLYKQARKNSIRAIALIKDKAISNIKYDNFINQERIAKINLQIANKTLKNREIQFKNTKIIAPESGLIISKNIDIGSISEPSRPLFTMIVGNKLELKSSISDSDSSLISKNMPVNIIVSKNPFITVNGKVRAISPTINKKTHQYSVFIDLPNNKRIKDGHFVTGNILLKSKKLLTIPSQSIVKQDGYNYVFIVNKNNKAIKKKITIDMTNFDNTDLDVVIKKGLTKTDNIILKGAGLVKDDYSVRIIQKQKTK